MNCLDLTNSICNSFTMSNNIDIFISVINKQKIFVFLCIILLVLFGAFEHVESDKGWIILVLLEIIKLHLCVLQPSLSLFKFFVVNGLKTFKFFFNIGEILDKYGFSGLLLNNQDVSHLFELLL